jgi:hypothetical protein
MKPDLKELLYTQLYSILLSLEDRNIHDAKSELKELLYQIENDQI